MNRDFWKPRLIMLSAGRSGSQIVTLTLTCISIELRLVPETGGSEWILKVDDTSGVAAVEWQGLSFTDSEGMRRFCPIHDVREVEPGVLAMTRI